MIVYICDRCGLTERTARTHDRHTIGADEGLAVRLLATNMREKEDD